MQIRSERMWKILDLCSEKPMRFGDLRRQLPITAAGLVINLRRLTSNNILSHINGHYVFTDKNAKSLKQILTSEQPSRQRVMKKLFPPQSPTIEDRLQTSNPPKERGALWRGKTEVFRIRISKLMLGLMEEAVRDGYASSMSDFTRKAIEEKIFTTTELNRLAGKMGIKFEVDTMGVLSKILFNFDRRLTGVELAIQKISS